MFHNFSIITVAILAQESQNYELKSLIYIVSVLKCTRWLCVPTAVQDQPGIASPMGTAVGHAEMVYYANVMDAQSQPGIASLVSTAVSHAEMVYYANVADARTQLGTASLASTAASHAEMVGHNEIVCI